MIDLALAQHRRPSLRRLVHAWIALALIAALLSATAFVTLGGIR